MIRHPMPHLTLLLLLASSCTGEARDVSESAEECGPSQVEGQVVACECDDGSESVQECLPGNLLSVCDCGPAEPVDEGEEPGEGDGEAGEGASSTGAPDEGEVGAEGDAADEGESSGTDGISTPSGEMGQGDSGGDPFGGMFGGGMGGEGDSGGDPFGGMFGGDTGGGQPGQFGGPMGGMGEPRMGTGDGEELEACAGDDECSPGLLCYVAGGFCTPECEDDSDCGELDGAEWTCGTTGSCRVICETEEQCPGDQVCNELPMGGGRCGEEGFTFGF